MQQGSRTRKGRSPSMFTGSRSDKRTGFLQRAAIAISPLPSLRLSLSSAGCSFSRQSARSLYLCLCCGGAVVPRIWSTRYPLTNRANVSAGARTGRTQCRVHTEVHIKHTRTHACTGVVSTVVYLEPGKFTYIRVGCCAAEGED